MHEQSPHSTQVESTKTPTLHITINPELRAWYERVAAHNERTMSYVVGKALELGRERLLQLPADQTRLMVPKEGS